MMHGNVREPKQTNRGTVHQPVSSRSASLMAESESSGHDLRTGFGNRFYSQLVSGMAGLEIRMKPG
jgi:hypothetical protein